MKTTILNKFKPMIAVSAMLASTLLVSQAHGETSKVTTNKIEVVAEITNTRPGNLTITPNGRMILSQQPLDAPGLRVVEVMANGELQPFPTLDWADGPEKGEVGFESVIGVHTTTDGIVWVLDMGSATSPAKLVAWDTNSNQLHKIIPIEKSATVDNSFLQDFAIDEKRQQIYIADTTLGNLFGAIKSAFVVVDIKTGKSRRVLQTNPKLMPPEHTVVVNGSVMGAKREDGSKDPIYLGLNPIAIDAQYDWVYFGTVNGSELFRIPASALADSANNDNQLDAKIEFYSKKRPSDGIVIDTDGTIYAGDIENSSVTTITNTGVEVIAQDNTLLSWPDGFAIDNGWLYVTQNQLHLTAPLNEGEAQGTKPYRILRIKIDK